MSCHHLLGKHTLTFSTFDCCCYSCECIRQIAVIHPWPVISQYQMMSLLHVSVYSLLCPLNHVLYLVNDDDYTTVMLNNGELNTRQERGT